MVKKTKKTKSAKPISAVFIWESVLPEPGMLHHFNYFDVYIYSPCVDPALPPLSAGYPTLLGFLLSLSP